VAALEDIIRSKEAADREKDRLALPTLRLLLKRIRNGRELSTGCAPRPKAAHASSTHPPSPEKGNVLTA